MDAGDLRSWDGGYAPESAVLTDHLLGGGHQGQDQVPWSQWLQVTHNLAIILESLCPRADHHLLNNDDKYRK